MRRTLLLLPLLIALAGCGDGGSTTTSTQTSPPTTTSTAVTTTPSKLPPPVDGIPCEQNEQLTIHYHAHLALILDGQPEPLPQYIGIIPVGNSGCIYWLHTHDTSGVIHIESPRPQTFTLASFFDIWGQPLSPSRAANLSGPLHVFVDGRPFAGDVRTIPLRRHEQITIESGRVVKPPTFTFPAGL